MTYQQAVAYLYEQLPAFQRVGAPAYKADLNNISALCNALDNPQESYSIIHVAGTNGKGSVCSMLASILFEAGYTTGLHTSPHLIDLRERMRVNGEMAPQAFVIEFLENHKNLSSKLKPSFFELTVAMSFDWFRKSQVDIAVIETGLGGRMDSTNIVNPILSVITNVSMDHTQFLGDTLEAIAGEKAGILKKNVPAVLGPENEALLYVFKGYGDKVGAKVHIAHPEGELPETDLKGSYQQDNIATVLGTVERLSVQGWNIEPKHVKKGLLNVGKNAGLRGRWEIINDDPTIIVDVCHNEAGLRASLESLKQHPYDTLHIVIGLSGDKDVESMIRLLPNATLYCTRSSVPRAMDPQRIHQAATKNGLPSACYTTAEEAVEAAKEHAGFNDLILVLGSIFLISDILKDY